MDRQLAPELSDQHRVMLEIESRRWVHPGAKDQAIRDLTGMKTTRYSQVLAWLIDQPAAEIYDAQLIRRLRRLRAARQSAGGRRPATAQPQG